MWPAPSAGQISNHPAGIAYLAFLAIQSLRSAAVGRYLPFDEERTRSTSSGEGFRHF
jgi:threonine/homoserine/homoserine lactone efflux protein